MILLSMLHFALLFPVSIDRASEVLFQHYPIHQPRQAIYLKLGYYILHFYKAQYIHRKMIRYVFVFLAQLAYRSASAPTRLVIP